MEKGDAWQGDCGSQLAEARRLMRAIQCDARKFCRLENDGSVQSEISELKRGIVATNRSNRTLGLQLACGQKRSEFEKENRRESW